MKNIGGMALSEDYLPLGSIVILKKMAKKVMIISRVLKVNEKGTLKEYDYAGCGYPEGLMGDRILFFNHDNIEEVYFSGCDDDENKKIADILKEYKKEKEK